MHVHGREPPLATLIDAADMMLHQIGRLPAGLSEGGKRFETSHGCCAAAPDKVRVAGVVGEAHIWDLDSGP